MDSCAAIRVFGSVLQEHEAGHSLAPTIQPKAALEDSDECLMAHIADGDLNTLAVLFRRYAGLVRSLSFRILRDDSEADDLVQELFLYQARKDAGLTQVEVSRRMGKPYSFLSKFELGERRVDFVELQQLAKIYRKELSFFMPD